MKTLTKSTEIKDGQIVDNEKEILNSDSEKKKVEESKKMTFRFGISVSIYFVFMAILFLALTIINSGKELIHPIMLVLMIFGAYSSYRKEYFTVNFNNNTYTVEALIGHSNWVYRFDKIIIKNNVPYRVINRDERKIKYLKLLLDKKDRKRLLEFIRKNSDV